MDQNGKYRELSNLIIESLEGVISNDNATELKRMLSQDPQALKYYLNIIDNYTILHHSSDLCSRDHSDKKTDKNYLSTELWNELAEDELTAPSIYIEKPVSHIQEPISDKPVNVKREVSRLAIYSLMLATAALLPFIILVLFAPVHPVVGILTDSINAEWITDHEVPAIGDVVREGELTLTKGLAEITFSNGAVVVVESPAIIELQGPKSMFVSSGTITAVVSEYATGFTVDTPSATIVDLGTEFGVDVKGDGACSLSMFKGKANLIAGRKDQKKTSQIIVEKQARSVDYKTGHVEDIAFNDKGYVRYIDSQSGLIWRGEKLDLADIVGGGNGFGTGTIGEWIDQSTGHRSQIYNNKSQVAKGAIHLVESLPFIDCVFIPSGGTGAVEISSKGHVFTDCPVTSGNTSENISNGGWINPSSTIKQYAMKLGGKVYGTAGQPAIYMHANSGITFDLQAIRSSLPDDVRLNNFSALCGISENAPQYSKTRGTADFYVLVDGIKRFEAKQMTPDLTPERVQIQINENYHFLTLITTDLDGISSQDWCLYAEPIIGLSLE